MLERIREGSQGPWAMVIIGLIVLSFVLAGVSSYVTSPGTTAAATVNGEEISQQDLERAYQSQRARLEAQFGEGISSLFSDESYLSDFKANVLDRLIADTLISQQATELGLRVSDEQIRETIVQMPEFQTAGTFDNDRYLALLRQNGFQASGFRDYLRTQLTREQLARALTASDFALDGEGTLAYQLQTQTRDADYLIIDSAPFAADVTVSDDEINAYYASHLTAFDTQEKVKLAYVSLNMEDLKADINISADEIEQYYNENISLYGSEEERRVSHILIEFGEDKEVAKTKAESLLAELEQGADFAQLAATESADTFSAENGGDLDFITAGMMDPSFDSAAFALADIGDYSDIVESEFGYHIIKLTDLKPASTTPLADVAAEIKQELVNEKASEEFYNLQSDMAEVAFEVPDSLEDVAGIIDTEVQETQAFTRSAPPAALDNPDVLAAAFSSELIDEGLNSDLIELDPSHVVVVRVVEHEPQRTKALDEVKASILARLRSEKAQEAAQEWAQSVVDAMVAGDAVDDLLAQRSLTWESKQEITRDSSDLPRNLVTELFTMSLSAEAPAVNVVSLATGNVGVVKLSAINTVDTVNDTDLASLKQSLTSAYSQIGYQSYINALRADADVKVFLN
jgi:peptidyl-prolyl cis-trans isomerase D